MGLLQRSSLVARGLGVVFGVLCVAGLGLPAAWSTRGGRRPVEPGHRHLPGRLCDHGRQDRDGPGQVDRPRDDRGPQRDHRGGRA